MTPDREGWQRTHGQPWAPCSALWSKAHPLTPHYFEVGEVNLQLSRDKRAMPKLQ